ncbi:MAG: hypothetical protein ACFFG0_06395 [Candidatus Thorarchaeota archaeon]
MIGNKSILLEFKKRKSTVDRILKWKDRAEEEKDIINKFIFRWISFNGLYSSLYDVIHMDEKAVRVREIDVVKEFCREFIETDNILASKIYSKERAEVFKESIKERSGLTGECLDNLESKESIELKAKCIVNIAYIIRCRLFHGKKSPLLEVNKEVASVADQVIQSILVHLLYRGH